MIFIFCNNNDYDIKQICEWLIRFKKEFRCVRNGVDFLKLIHFSKDDFVFSIGKDSYKFSEIDSVLFKFGSINLTPFFDFKVKPDKARDNIDNSLKYFLSARSNALRELMEEKFNSLQRRIGRSRLGRVNKMLFLEIANSTGLNVPEYLLTTNKNELTLFKNRFRRIINKSIDINFEFFDIESKKRYYQFTKEVDDELLRLVPDEFGLSMFQELIEKDFELRVLFFDNEVYATKILSQDNKNTELDYRRYDLDKMNRLVPYSLPSTLKVKLRKFMKEVDLNFGSIDLIKSISGDFYFLECNPEGQYGMVSLPCNYHLDYSIAKYLSNYGI